MLRAEPLPVESDVESAPALSPPPSAEQPHQPLDVGAALKMAQSWAAHAVKEGARVLGDASAPKNEAEREALYAAALERGATETFHDFEALGFLRHSVQPDARGAAVVVIAGARLPQWDASLDADRFRRFVYKEMKDTSEAPFVVVYCHAGVTPLTRPCASWLLNAFDALPSSWHANLGAFYVLHPASTLASFVAILPLWLFSPLAAGDFTHKIVYVDRLELLASHGVTPASLHLDANVWEHDKALEGQALSNVRPPTDELGSYVDACTGLPAYS